MITREEVQHIAKLARLGLTEQEVEKYQKELSAILGYIEKLKEVDVSKVEPTSQAVLLENIMRKDEKSPAFAKSSAGREKLLALMPETKDGYLKVKSIF